MGQSILGAIPGHISNNFIDSLRCSDQMSGSLDPATLEVCPKSAGG